MMVAIRLLAIVRVTGEPITSLTLLMMKSSPVVTAVSQPSRKRTRAPSVLTGKTRQFGIDGDRMPRSSRLVKKTVAMTLKTVVRISPMSPRRTA